MQRTAEFLYIFGTVGFTVYGQLILKWRLSYFGELPAAFGDKVVFLLRALLDPFIFSGLVAAFVASLFWMAAMTKFDLGFAYPLVTAGLTILTPLLAVALLGEHLTLNRMIAIILIIAGVLIMARDG